MRAIGETSSRTGRRYRPPSPVLSNTSSANLGALQPRTATTHTALPARVSIGRNPSPRTPGNIGYWGDHQIIYLLKLLESAEAHFPGSVLALLDRGVSHMPTCLTESKGSMRCSVIPMTPLASTSRSTPRLRKRCRKSVRMADCCGATAMSIRSIC